MKKLISIMLVLMFTAVALTGCGKEERILYNVDLSKYIDLGEYKGIPVDVNSDTVADYKESIISSDIENNDLYKNVTEGVVADGDTVNINYVGKKDGVAFEGGTASGAELEIGSNTFIDGFESGLIGVNIGDTVDLNLTFPTNYSNSPELAGQAVVFNVTVNYVIAPLKPEEYYSRLNFKSVDEYNADVEKRAVKNYLIDAILKNSKSKGYPQEDLDMLYKSAKDILVTNIQSTYGISFSDYLGYVEQTEEEFKASVIAEQIKPMMDAQMAVYAIFDKEGFELTEEALAEKTAEIMSDYNSDVTEQNFKDYYGEYYFEYIYINDTVTDFLYENAEIS